MYASVLLRRFVIVLLLGSCLPAAQAQVPAISPRIANYHIKVSLDAETKTLSGTERLSWTNPSTDTIRRIPFHLYLNAFKNTRSTFIQEGQGEFLFSLVDPEDTTTWGWIDIDAIHTVDGQDLSDRTTFIQPDDNNADDQTVLELRLTEALLPGQTLELDIAFSARLPKIIARTGYGYDYFFVAQWYPKIGVYEPAGMRYAKTGQWNCHQFHASTEFYGDFGVYDVEITLPQRFVVGASGSLIQQKDHTDGTQTLHYQAEDVTDFAWTASPFFTEIQDSWQEVSIRLLIQPEHLMHADRYLQSAKYALEYLGEHVGPYVYPTLTIVDPPIYGVASSGMEYPTLFTGGSFYGLPEGIRSVEILTVHEFGHQYFMQMLATNEMEEPWMDEGFNTYWENRVMDHYYGAKTSAVDLLGIHRGGVEGSRLAYVGMKYPQMAANYGVPWQFPDQGAYFTLTYDKTGAWLATLEGLLGRETMDHIFQRYYQRWRFGHPCARDFIAVVQEVAAADRVEMDSVAIDAFFAQVLYGRQVGDYELASIENVAIPPDYGRVDKAGGSGFFAANEPTDSLPATYESTVMIVNRGTLQLPVEILIRFADGSEERRKWDGKDPAYSLYFYGTEAIVSAQIDPEGKNRMDLNQNNNSLTLEPDSRPIWKYIALITGWMQQWMLVLGTLM